MLRLPVELRRCCLQLLKDDVETLKAIRLVNKDLGNLATKILFRTATLNNTNQSADKFCTLLASDFSSMVRRVVVHTSDDPEHTSWDDDEETEEAEVVEAFSKAIAIICDFEKLEEVEVKFARECIVDGWHRSIAETVDFRYEVLELLFTSVAQASKLKSLTIKNLQDHMEKRIFESRDFKTVRGRLTQLHLQIATEHDDEAPEYNIDKLACHEGFGHGLPEYWLKPLLNQLTHLTLFGLSCPWGIWPFVDLRNIGTLPRLRSLSLGKFTIAHDWQVDWIISHASTLEELILDDCPIVTALHLLKDQTRPNFPDLPVANKGGPHESATWFKIIDIRWHHVLERFRGSLPRLRQFALDSSRGVDTTAFEERYQLLPNLSQGRYCMFDCGIALSQWLSKGQKFSREGRQFHIHYDRKPEYVEFPQCDEEDLAALVAFLKMVEERSRAKA